MSRESLQAIEDAIVAHFHDITDDGDSEARQHGFIVNWVACYTISGVVPIDGVTVVGFTNEYAAAPGDPNAAANLVRWCAVDIDQTITHRTED